MKQLVQKIKNINNQIAISGVSIVSTMGCTWLFFVWSILPLGYPSAQSVVFYVSGGILQLVLLPLIMVGQRLSSTKSNNNHKTLADKHEKLDHVISDIHMLLSDQTQEVLLLKIMIADQKTVLEKLINLESKMSRLEETKVTQEFLNALKPKNR